MSYQDEMGPDFEQRPTPEEIAEVAAEDERLCRAHEAARLALDVIRLSYRCDNEEANRYNLYQLREQAWRMVAGCLTEMRGYRVSIVAVAPRWRGRRCVPRFKAVRA